VPAVDRRADRLPHAVDLHARDGGEAGEEPFHAGRAGPDHGEVVDGPAAEPFQHDDLHDVGAGDTERARHLSEGARAIGQGDAYPQQHSSPPGSATVVVHPANMAFRPGCAAVSHASRHGDMSRVTAA